MLTNAFTPVSRATAAMITVAMKINRVIDACPRPDPNKMDELAVEEARNEGVVDGRSCARGLPEER